LIYNLEFEILIFLGFIEVFKGNNIETLKYWELW